MKKMVYICDLCENIVDESDLYDRFGIRLRVQEAVVKHAFFGDKIVWREIALCENCYHDIVWKRKEAPAEENQKKG